MAQTWKAGVIGCGAIAQALHLPGYAKVRGVSLTAACDPARPRWPEARRFCPSLRMYDDYGAMLENESLDVVSVATPNCFHAEHACASLRAGAHVFLEKPAALSMEEISQIKQTARQSKRRVVIGFSQRFYRGNHKVQKLLKAGAIGEPYMIRIRLAHKGPYPGWAKDDWFYKPKLAGGGALLDMGIHAIDQALWHMGPVRTVQATARTLRKRIQVDDNAVLLLEFARSRAVGYIEVGWTSPSGFSGIEIMGDEGCIIEDYAGALTLTTSRMTADRSAAIRRKTRVIDKRPATGGWPIEIREVVKALRNGSDLGIGIDVGGSALAVALAAYESSRTGRRVNVSEVR